MCHPRLSQLLDAAIVGCLLILPAALWYGHLDGGARNLSLTESYVTEYIKGAPHWPWLVVSSFAFAVLLGALAVAFLLRMRRSPGIVCGCLLLATTSMASFFAAYAPVRRVEQPPPPRHSWWTPAWWFTSRTAHTDYDRGMADAYSDVHYRATRLVVVTVVSGIALLGAGFLSEPCGRRFGIWSLAAALAMSILFLMGDRLDLHRGLWQRLAFTLLYLWLWSARHACRRHPGPHTPAISRNPSTP